MHRRPNHPGEIGPASVAPQTPPMAPRPTRGHLRIAHTTTRPCRPPLPAAISGARPYTGIAREFARGDARGRHKHDSSGRAEGAALRGAVGRGKPRYVSGFMSPLRPPPPRRAGLRLGAEPPLALRRVDARLRVRMPARHVVNAGALPADVPLDAAIARAAGHRDLPLKRPEPPSQAFMTHAASVPPPSARLLGALRRPVIGSSASRENDHSPFAMSMQVFTYYCPPSTRETQRPAGIDAPAERAIDHPRA